MEILDGRPGHELGGRDPCWYRNWLEREPYFTRQPYRQLASVLRTEGDSDRADAVLYAARERELREAWRTGDYGSRDLSIPLASPSRRTLASVGGRHMAAT